MERSQCKKASGMVNVMAIDSSCAARIQASKMADPDKIYRLLPDLDLVESTLGFDVICLRCPGLFLLPQT